MTLYGLFETYSDMDGETNLIYHDFYTPLEEL